MSAHSTGLIALTLLMLAGCDASGPRNTGVYMLVDTSGTYRQELDRAEQIINYTLSRLDAHDSFAIARIDTGSFSEKDIVATVTFDDRPSAANQQKREFSQTAHEFLTGVGASPYTDITGGLLQAVEFLNEKGPQQKRVFIFSDLKEDLEAGYIRDIPVPLQDVEVFALNVTKLRSDNIDPREYLDRLEAWRARVESEGGTWRVINDLDNLEQLLDN
ncbi:MAG TPA: VWA domain-containing protein [Gammaproteobacteria bacterium]|nr:VWA domain-containing protein [Gammaproteobacteria bacterium]